MVAETLMKKLYNRNKELEEYHKSTVHTMKESVGKVSEEEKKEKEKDIQVEDQRISDDSESKSFYVNDDDIISNKDGPKEEGRSSTISASKTAAMRQTLNSILGKTQQTKQEDHLGKLINDLKKREVALEE